MSIAVSKAKCIIMREMILKGKLQFAEEYLNKCLVTFSHHSSVLEHLLTKYSKLMKNHYPTDKLEKNIDFMLEVKRKAAVSVSD